MTENNKTIHIQTIRNRAREYNECRQTNINAYAQRKQSSVTQKLSTHKQTYNNKNKQERKKYTT